MPSPIAHITTGYAIYRVFNRRLPIKTLRFGKIPYHLLLVAFLSLLPDIDFLFGLVFGDIEKYHNNFTHSLLFGILVALITSATAYWIFRSHFIIFFIVSLISYNLHPILDLFTGERGVMLFWPIIQDRFSSPVKLFYGVQWGLGLISIWHIWTILSELLFSLFVLIVINFYDKRWSVNRSSTY